jgi:hypothetical protein
MKLENANLAAVGTVRDDVAVMSLRTVFTPERALNLAAWLVVMAELQLLMRQPPSDYKRADFTDLLDAVRNS